MPAQRCLISAGLATVLLAAALAVGEAAALGGEGAGADSPPFGVRVFAHPRDPPTYRTLTRAEQVQRALGLAVFNTQFVPAGTTGAARIDGLGPFFDAASCDECHNDGAHGRGPVGDGPAPTALVVQLEPPGPPGGNATAVGADPRYGHVLSTAALDGMRPEATVLIHYTARIGRYPDGSAWQLRMPSYELSALRYGPLASTTVVRPRIAPPLFGDGLLEAVPSEAIIGTGSAGGTASKGDTRGQGAVGLPAWQWINGQRVLGRFGWQGNAISIPDQTARALAREMGLTSRDTPRDDCTSIETDCRNQPSGGEPEVSDELFEALVQFVRELAVPAAAAAPDTQASAVDPGFLALGCADCHRPQLPVRGSGAGGPAVRASIAAYTDLRLHDLGTPLADRDASGHPVTSFWRTAPLWGEGYRLAHERAPTFLHDGRARSLEEAILWHAGEAAPARAKFEQLSRAQREALLRWLATR